MKGSTAMKVKQLYRKWKMAHAIGRARTAGNNRNTTTRVAVMPNVLSTSIFYEPGTTLHYI